MKKLKLNLQNIEGAELLTREQLKTVMGGSGTGGGSGDDGTGCTYSDTTCSATSCTITANGKSVSGTCSITTVGNLTGCTCVAS